MHKISFILLLVLVPLLGSAQKRMMMKPAALNKLLPSRLPGYRPEGNAKATDMAIGTLKYSLAERFFAARDRKIRILLFDYAEAPVMYSQSIKKWEATSEVVTDSIRFVKRSIENGTIWENYQVRANRVQIFCGIHGRFFMTLEGENVTDVELRDVFHQIDLSKFPR